ncbi:MAG: ISAs1 family transposase [Okeania sp. SIO2H7]|nr:ISAs1 family transposase [Okeania sp. SIO2H7]
MIDSKNDYVIAVKNNQKELLAKIEEKTRTDKPVSSVTDVETISGRRTTRTVEVYRKCQEIDTGWKGVKTFIKVTRSGTRGGEPYQSKVYYISSKEAEAQLFAQGIRGHWRVENQLHWVKDVVLKEDNLPIHQNNAATNFSVIRNIILNILRWFGYTSITQAQRFLSNDLLGILELLRE